MAGARLGRLTFEHLGDRCSNIEHKVFCLVPSPVLNISRSSTIAVGGRQYRETFERLSSALREWCNRENADWDAQQVEGSRSEAVSDATDSELWDSMPTIDSKAIARTSPIF